MHTINIAAKDHPFSREIFVFVREEDKKPKLYSPWVPSICPESRRSVSASYRLDQDISGEIRAMSLISWFMMEKEVN